MIMFGACSHRQWVTTTYPRWGEEFSLSRGHGQSPLTLRISSPERRQRAEACLLLLHGMNEYSGRYHEIARHFARRFIVAGFDLSGHGLSNAYLDAADRAIADGGRAYDVSDAFLAQRPLSDLEPMRADLDLVLRRLLLECGGDKPLPVFIVSHSLGSLVAASYLLSERGQDQVRERIQGIVLLGPAFSVTRVPGWLGAFANPVIRWSFASEEWCAAERPAWMSANALTGLWALPSSMFLNGLFEVLSWPGLRQLFTPVTPVWVVNYLTDWEAERVRHRADGYIIRRSLLRYVKGVEREIARFRHRMRDLDVPYLVFYSADDLITPAWGVRDFLERTHDRHPDNAVSCLQDKNHHEHLFSAPPLNREILQRIDAWIDRRLRAADSAARKSGP